MSPKRVTSPILGPGVYHGRPETLYHADADLAPRLGRSLSQSGAKTLLDSPQRFAWERAAKYEQAARTRLERAITFHKLGTPMSEPMIADLASAVALENDHYAKAEKGEA